MDRRRFLTLAASGTVAGATGLTLVRASGQATRSGDPEVELVRETWETARALGKPLLVLVFPQRLGKYTGHRGREFGTWLNHASPRGMAELALVEVVCATNRSVKRVFPQLKRLAIPGLPLMGLIGTEGAYPQTAPAEWLQTELTEMPDGFLAPDQTRNAIAAANADQLETLLRARLIHPPGRLPALASQAASALPSEERENLEELLETGHAPLGILADRGAALVLLSARRSPARRSELIDLLAQVTIQRLRIDPPRGALWANSTGCGAKIEGDDPRASSGPLCGMAFVPELSRRFLYFYRKA